MAALSLVLKPLMLCCIFANTSVFCPKQERPVSIPSISPISHAALKTRNPSSPELHAWKVFRLVNCTFGDSCFHDLSNRCRCRGYWKTPTPTYRVHYRRKSEFTDA